MNPSTNNPLVPASANANESAEATLRLIAALPAPEGLEDRVQAALNRAPRAARVLAWPTMLRPQAGSLRAAAAAAIVFVVAGGGWAVYLRVQPALQSGAKAAPLHVASPSAGFSSAGAMRTPQTLNGPVAPLAQPAKATVKAAAKPGQTASRSKSLAKTKAKNSAFNATGSVVSR